MKKKSVISLLIGLLAGILGGIIIGIYHPTSPKSSEIDIPDSLQIEEISASPDGHVYCLGVDSKLNQHIVKL